MFLSSNILINNGVNDRTSETSFWSTIGHWSGFLGYDVIQGTWKYVNPQGLLLDDH